MTVNEDERIVEDVGDDGGGGGGVGSGISGTNINATASVKAETNLSENSDSSTMERERRNSQSDLLAKPSHFVTVIEVKEPTAVPGTTTTNVVTTTTTTTQSTTSSFKSVRSGYENVIIENNKRNSNSLNDSEKVSQTSSFTSSFNNFRPKIEERSAIPSIAMLQDAKKKIPPR